MKSEILQQNQKKREEIILFWHSHLNKAENYINRRGIKSKELTDYYLIGYQEQGQKGTPFFKSFLVLPYNNKGTYYTLRKIEGDEKTPRYLKPRNEKETTFFNQQAIEKSDYIIITEGIIDSLSIFQAFIENGYKFDNGIILYKDKKITTIAINGTANIKLLREYLKANIEKIREKNFLIAFDLDQETNGAGQKATTELIKELDNIAIRFNSFVWNDYSALYKDCNERLINDKENFFQDIELNIEYFEPTWQEEIKEYDYNLGSEKEIKEYKAKPKLEFFKTPKFKEFQNSLGGGITAGLITIGAISSLGKTTFCLNLAQQLYEENNEVIFFSLEASKIVTYAKIMSSMIFEKNKKDFDNPNNLTPRQILRFSSYEQKDLIKEQLLEETEKEFIEETKGRFFVFEYKRDMNINYINDIIRNHIKIKKKRPIVFIDYLQKIKGEDPHETDKQRIDNIVDNLGLISSELNIPIILISSFNRENYYQEVSMKSFKESGGIEYSSDVAFALQPSEIKDTKTEQENKKQIKGHKENDIRKIKLIKLKDRLGEAYKEISYNYYAKYFLFEEDNEQEE